LLIALCLLGHPLAISSVASRCGGGEGGGTAEKGRGPPRGQLALRSLAHSPSTRFRSFSVPAPCPLRLFLPPCLARSSQITDTGQAGAELLRISTAVDSTVAAAPTAAAPTAAASVASGGRNGATRHATPAVASGWPPPGNSSVLAHLPFVRQGREHASRQPGMIPNWLSSARRAHLLATGAPPIARAGSRAVCHCESRRKTCTSRHCGLRGWLCHARANSLFVAGPRR